MREYPCPFSPGFKNGIALETACHTLASLSSSFEQGYNTMYCTDGALVMSVSQLLYTTVWIQGGREDERTEKEETTALQDTESEATPSLTTPKYLHNQCMYLFNCVFKDAKEERKERARFPEADLKKLREMEEQ